MAVVARAGWGAARVVVCFLIEGHGVARVHVAKDVTATAAMVAARKVAKGSLASRVVAHGRRGIGLPVSPRRHSSHIRKQLNV